MNKSCILRLITIAIILFSSIAIFAEAENKPNEPTQKVESIEPEIVYSSEQFDPNVNALPVNYKGNGIYPVIIQFTKMFQKDEFETTDNYKKRFQENCSTEEAKTYAFGYENNLKMSYDADKQKLYLRVGRDCDDIRGFILKDDIVINSYKATNGFGAQVEVSKFTGYQYGIFMREDGKKFNKAMDNLVRGGISIDSNEARELKDNLGLLFIVKPKPNNVWYFIVTFKNQNTPTFKIPFDVDIEQKLLSVNISSIWLYNKKTGKVYLKAPVN